MKGKRFGISNAVLLARARGSTTLLAMNEKTLADLAEKAEAGQDLSDTEIQQVANLLTSGEPDLEEKERLLLTLAEKGESPSEIAAFADCFRKLARNPEVDRYAEAAIDVCGTGGDKSGSFNVSTTVAFILASAGVPVFKHGNRSITSKCGSADLLEAVGIPLEANPETLGSSLKELSFAFFFAPAYHPAFKEIIPVRKSLAAKGQRTVFNILGPLINPGRPAHQLLGVFSSSYVPALASCLNSLGLRRGLVVHSALSEGGNMDELSGAGINSVAGVGELAEMEGKWKPEDFGLRHHAFSELSGGDVSDNLSLLSDLCIGKAPRGLMDTICWNAGVAFWIVDKSPSVEEGIFIAKDLLLGGEVASWLNNAKSFYADHHVA